MLKSNIKKVLIGSVVAIFVAISSGYAQSVSYYPWSGLLGVSTNPTRPFWLDTRLQTNTLFGSLSTEVLPMYNFKRRARAQFYGGGGVRFNFIAAIAGSSNRILEGYSLHIGTRLTPFTQLPQVQIAFELAPYVGSQFDTGILKSNFGLVYRFQTP